MLPSPPKIIPLPPLICVLEDAAAIRQLGRQIKIDTIKHMGDPMVPVETMGLLDTANILELSSMIIERLVLALELSDPAYAVPF